MKIRNIFVLMLTLCFVIAGCSNSTEEKTFDKAFLNDFAKGLSARWDLNDKVSVDMPENEHYEKLVQAELDKVSSYINKKFEDTVLQEKAVSYINLLNTQKEALSYYGVDYEKYDKLWAEAFDDRTQIIKDLIETYNLEFPQRHSKTVNEILTNAKLANDADDLDNKAKQMTESIVFNKVKTSGNYSYYEAVIENITDKTFEYFSIDINLLDIDGVIIESDYCSVNNFEPGKKAKIEFSTDSKFEKYELTADYYVKD